MYNCFVKLENRDTVYVKCDVLRRFVDLDSARFQTIAKVIVDSLPSV